MTRENEKRKYLRLDVGCEVGFTAETEAGGKKKAHYIAAVKNLSVKGLAFEFLRELPLGKVLGLELKSQSKPQTLKLKGEIKRCTPVQDDKSPEARFVIGVKFLDSDKKLTAALLPFVRSSPQR